MIKLLSQLEHVESATPLARRLDGKISDGIAPIICQCHVVYSLPAEHRTRNRAPSEILVLTLILTTWK